MAQLAVNGAVEAAIRIGQMLMFTEQHEQKEIIQSGINFDKFNQKIVIQHSTGCSLDDWERFIPRLCKRYEIPHNVQEDLLDAAFFEDSKQVVVDFKFQKGSGEFIMARIATIKRDNKMDFGLLYFGCGYQMTPNKIIHTKKRKFLGMTYGKSTHIEYVPRNLSKNQLKGLEAYFCLNAIESFKRQAPPALLPPERQ